NACEPIAEPGRRGLPVQLQRPEPEPSALLRRRGELAVKRLGGGEPRAPGPARPVEAEERVEIVVEAALVREPEGRAPFLEPPFGRPELAAEVRASRREVVLP